MTSEVKFSEPKQSGSFKKISITTSNGKKLMVQTDKCFSLGVKKSDRYDSYSLPLFLKNDSEALRALEAVLQKCQEHLPDETFSKLLYGKPENNIKIIYPRLKYYKGSFSTNMYEGDNEVNPREYIDKKCSAVTMLHIDSILIGDKTSLSVKVLEAEVSEPEQQPKRRLIDRSPAVKTETDSDSRGMSGHTCPGC